MAVNDKISTLVQNQFPDFYKEEGEKFIAFMEAYYEYMEQKGKLTDSLQNFSSYTDINETTEEYLDYFLKTFLPSVPVDVIADKRLMVKYIKEGNLARGTLQSYKFLFRALYNEDLQLSYPADQILKVSDGDWRMDRYVVVDFDPQNYKFIGKTVVGAESGTTALVEDVVTRTIKGRHLMQILLSKIQGTFNHLEPIKLVSDTSANTHAPRMDAGIKSVSVLSPGGEYQRGDVVDILSDKIGQFGKVVVTDTVDLGGTLTFSILNGGSGYTPTDEPDGSIIQIYGGDGNEPASFTVSRNDITDTFEVTTCITFLHSNTAYGDLAPTVTFSDGLDRQMNYFANTVLSSPDFGFAEEGDVHTSKNFVDNEGARIKVANTRAIYVGDSIFGVTSGANGSVTSILNPTNGAAVFAVDGYKQFTGGETVRLNFADASGTSVGTVSAFAANNFGKQVVEIGRIDGNPISEGQELVGINSNAYGVIRKVLKVETDLYEHAPGDFRDLVTVIVSANNTANTTDQFQTGSMHASYLENEPLRFVGSSTVVGNSATSTANTVYENVYTSLKDSILFTNDQYGTIERLSDVVGGSGYSIAPTVSITDGDISSLGIGEAYITLQSDDPDWGTSNSQFSLDTTDRLRQASTSALGDVKTIVSSVTHANGTNEVVARVWQKYLQRFPGNVNWANDSIVTLESVTGEYIPGTQDLRSADYTGSAKIVYVDDRGILGRNAEIKANVGANGTISKLRVIDSGFSYDQNEIARLEATNRPLATSATVKVALGGAGNSEGYYASTRSQVSTTRGYIQDSVFYQEFSYQIISGIGINRYRDIALKLVHPAGQSLYGKFSTTSNAYLDVISSSVKTFRTKSSGTVTLTSGSYNIDGVGTNFSTDYSDDGSIIIEKSHKNFMTIPINTVLSDTQLTTKVAWSNNTISSANAYYITGSF